MAVPVSVADGSIFGHHFLGHLESKEGISHTDGLVNNFGILNTKEIDSSRFSGLKGRLDSLTSAISTFKHGLITDDISHLETHSFRFPCLPGSLFLEGKTIFKGLSSLNKGVVQYVSSFLAANRSFNEIHIASVNKKDSQFNNRFEFGELSRQIDSNRMLGREENRLSSTIGDIECFSRENQDLQFKPIVESRIFDDLDSDLSNEIDRENNWILRESNELDDLPYATLVAPLEVTDAVLYEDTFDGLCIVPVNEKEIISGGETEPRSTVDVELPRVSTLPHLSSKVPILKVNPSPSKLKVDMAVTLNHSIEMPSLNSNSTVEGNRLVPTIELSRTSRTKSNSSVSSPELMQYQFNNESSAIWNESLSFQYELEEMVDLKEVFGSLIGTFRSINLKVNSINSKLDSVVFLTRRWMGNVVGIDISKDSSEKSVRNGLAVLDVISVILEDSKLNCKLFGKQFADHLYQDINMITSQIKEISQEIKELDGAISGFILTDAPEFLEYLNHLSDSDNKFLNSIENDVYKDFKNKLVVGVDGAVSHVKQIKESVSPISELIKGFNRGFLSEVRYILMTVNSEFVASQKGQ